MQLDISAIIVNYNAGEFLRKCVDSLLNCPLKIEIIIIDNASKDNSVESLNGLPKIHLIKNSTNVGFATACNQGSNKSTAPVLLFLNPDCTFNSGTLVRLLSVMNHEPQAGMVGGLLVNSDGTEQAGGRRAIPTPWRSFVRAFGLTRLVSRWPKLFYDFHLHRQPLPEYPIEVEAISGACMMVRRDAVEDVGEWDEGYFLHCEDLDWCMRFRKKGWKILFVPDAKITHAAGVCSRGRKLFVEWHKHKGMIRFYRKFFAFQYPAGLMGLVIIGVWLRFGIITITHSTNRLRRVLCHE
ncbi:MAG: glycosyl transferase family 2 [Solimicrobium sp.]|nr:glycosyl transferase family 2 [Solimicrobium sp.]